jgi:mycothiol synthase
VNVRAAREDEVPAIAGLIDEYAQQVFGESELTEAEIRHWFTLPRISMSVAEQDGRLVGYVDALKPGDDSVTDHFLMTLDAAAARALLDAAEKQAGGGTLHVVSQGDDPVLPEVLPELGYRPVRHSFQMRIKLDDDLTEPAWPVGIAVRAFRPGEERHVYEANNLVFTDGWYFQPFPFEEWREFHFGRPGHDPELWWLAEDGDELAGYSLNSWHFSGDPQLGRVGSLGVLPAYRRRGLGEAFLRHSFRDFRERGATQVALGVDAENETGAVRLYERVGMHLHRRDTTYEKTL